MTDQINIFRISTAHSTNDAGYNSSIDSAQFSTLVYLALDFLPQRYRSPNRPVYVYLGITGSLLLAAISTISCQKPPCLRTRLIILSLIFIHDAPDSPLFLYAILYFVVYDSFYRTSSAFCNITLRILLFASLPELHIRIKNTHSLQYSLYF